MANFTLTVTENTQRGVSQATIGFISWSPYPQVKNKKTELINRIGSEETLTQTLYKSSSPIGGMATQFLANSNITDIRALQDTMNSMVGVECSLTDALNNGVYNRLVITDLTTRIKKAADGWLLICEFTQHLRKE